MKASHHLTLVFLCLLSAVLLGTTPIHAAPGDLDSLDANIGGNNFVFATAEQADGKTIIAGSFFSVLGQPRNNIARLNADGTLDAGFNPNVNGGVYSVAVQADGQILLGGYFSTVGGTPRNNIARVAANGTLDAGFNPNANNIVYSVAVQADGQILLGGGFTSVGGTGLNRIARVAANSTLDTGFYPNPNGDVRSVAVQADGKILLGGGFTAVGGTTRNRIARVSANGTLDAGFNPNATSLNNGVRSVALQADGQILLGGDFTSVGGTTRSGIARVAANGTLDASFNPNAYTDVLSVAVQADGQILLGGGFTSMGGTMRNRIARVASNGTLDASFNPNADSGVYSVAVQADGKILLGGNFATVGGIARISFARLLNDPAAQTLSATDTSQVIWTRGGSTPEIAQVTVEQSTDNGTTWTALGSATRMGSTANWQLTGLNLPTSVQLRARGRTSGGNNNGSSGLIEQVASFSGLLPPEINVTQASPLADGISHVAFGTVFVGSSAPLTFTITNPGTADLSNLVLTVDGTDSGDFMVSALSATSLPVGAGTSTFTVTFSPTASGAKTAALHIASNLTGTENPFDIVLTGTGMNYAPTISNITNQSIGVNTLTNSLPFTIGDNETAAASLTVSGTSSNQALVPGGSIFFGGSGTNRTVTVVPETNQFGTVTISVSVSDGELTATDTFVVTVLGADIAVEQPFNSNIADGGTKSFGTVAVGQTAV
jgi:uncharacterized delta-60 repeat protein